MNEKPEKKIRRLDAEVGEGGLVRLSASSPVNVARVGGETALSGIDDFGF